MRQIVFVGGIHGVGKSTLCRELAVQLNMDYLLASDLLRWKDLNTDEKNKKVTDIPDTQGRLIDGLRAIVQLHKKYILDGHYCLFNKEGSVTQVPMYTFEQIAPLALILVIGNVKQIKSNLAQRDARNYDSTLLTEMQKREYDYAVEISQKLGVPLYTHNNNQDQLPVLINQINESFT